MQLKAQNIHQICENRITEDIKPEVQAGQVPPLIPLADALLLKE